MSTPRPSQLTGFERQILLRPCDSCGHSINGHGTLLHCWLCEEDAPDDCPRDFEDMLCERIAELVEHRLNRGPE